MEPVSLAASVVTLLSTTRAITVAFHNAFSAFKEAPEGIENLLQEHNSLRAVIESLRKTVDERMNEGDLDLEIDAQTRSVICDTQATLNEFHAIATSPVPAMQVRFRNEKPTLYQLQARRDALSLILNMSSTVDGTKIKKELSSIRSTLESRLISLRSAEFSDNPVSECPSSPGSISSSKSLRCSIGSFNFTQPSSIGTPSDVSSGADDGRPSVKALALRFDHAISTGAAKGPAGEAIGRRIQQSTAQAAAAVGFGILQPPASRPESLATAPGKIRALIQSLSAKEAAASGLSSEESATAAQALAKAYQDANQLESALEYYHQALAARKFLLGPTHPTTLNTIDIIAAVFEIQSRWQDALEYYQQSLVGRGNNDALGPNHPSILSTATRVARMRSKTGESEVALQEYESILAKYQSMPKGGSTAALAVRADIAKLHLQLGNQDTGLPEAQAVLADYQKLLDTREEKFGPNHRLTKDTQNVVDTISEAIRIAEHPEPQPAEDGDIPPLTDPFLTPLAPDLTSPTLPQTSPLSSGAQSTPSFPEIDSYEKKLISTRAINGDNHPKTLEIMFNLADAYARHEQFEPAISWFLEALCGQEITLGRIHPTTLTTVHELGVCYTHRGEHVTALKYLDRALKGRRTKLSDNHPQTLNTLQQIAKVHKGLVDLAKAIEFMREAVDGCESKYGPKHQITLSAKFQLAEIYREQGSYASAAEQHEEVLQGRTETDGPNHPSVLASKFQLAVVYRAQGENAKAIPLLCEAFEGHEKVYGELHSATTATASQLASAYWAVNKWDEALDYYFVALKGIQNGQKGNATAGTVFMANIALCYVQLSMHENALSWYEKVLKVYEKERGMEDEKTVEAAVDVARASLECEKFDAAVEYYQRALAVKEKTLPPTDETIIQIIFHLGFATSRSGQSERSLMWGKRLVDLGNSVEIKDRLVTMRRMGLIYAQQGKNTEALDLLQQAIDECKASLGEEHILTQKISDDIQDVYHKIHNEIDELTDLEQLRETIRQLLEKNEPMGVRLLLQLAQVHERQHMQHEALSLLEEALDAIQYLPSTLDLLNLKHVTISSIVDAHLALCNNQAALTYLQILDREGDSSWKVGVLIRMGTAHENESNFDTAITIFKEVLSESERKSGLDSINALCCVRKIGNLNLLLGNTQESLHWTQRALAGFRRSQDAEAKVQEMTTLGLTSSINLGLGDLDSAMDTQKECVEGFEKELGPLHERTLAAALDLAEIYDILEYHEEALRWYRKAIRGYRTNLGALPTRAMRAEEQIQRLEVRGVTVRDV